MCSEITHLYAYMTTPAWPKVLTHQVLHIYAWVAWAVIDSHNGMSLVWHQVTILSNLGLFLTGHLGKYFNVRKIKQPEFSYKKMYLNISSVKWWAFYLFSLCSPSPIPCVLSACHPARSILMRFNFGWDPKLQHVSMRTCLSCKYSSIHCITLWSHCNSWNSLWNTHNKCIISCTWGRSMVIGLLLKIQNLINIFTSHYNMACNIILYLIVLYWAQNVSIKKMLLYLYRNPSYKVKMISWPSDLIMGISGTG